jgi:hypothetical protein
MEITVMMNNCLVWVHFLEQTQSLVSLRLDLGRQAHLPICQIGTTCHYFDVQPALVTHSMPISGPGALGVLTP